MPLCAATVAAVMLLDVCLRHCNLSVLYIIPLLLCGTLNRRRLLVKLGLCLVSLTYLGYVAKMLVHGRVLDHPRMPNRHLVALTLLMMTAVLYFWRGLSGQVRQHGYLPQLRFAEPSLFEEMGDSIACLLVGSLCLILIGALMAMDLTTPTEVNLPILFAIPLVLAGWSRSLKLLWTLVLVLSVCVWVGLFIGPGISEHAKQDHVTYQTLIVNRTLANLMVLAVAGILHMVITAQNAAIAQIRRRQRDSSWMASDNLRM